MRDCKQNWCHSASFRTFFAALNMPLLLLLLLLLPFYSHFYTDNLHYLAPPVKNWRILLQQSFTARTQVVQPYTEQISRSGPESSSVEADVYVWCYALLVVHARKEGKEDTHPCWWQLAHSDYGKDARVLHNSTTCTISILPILYQWKDQI